MQFDQNDKDNQNRAALARLFAAQRRQRGTRGTLRRSKYLLAIEMGELQRGTRAKSRGPYPAHMIANNEIMRARAVASKLAGAIRAAERQVSR